MAIKITREEYEKKFGVAPSFSTPSQPIQKEVKEPNYFQRVGSQYAQAGQDIISGVQQGAGQIQAGGIGGGVRAGLRTVGGVAKATFAPIIEAPGIKQAFEGFGRGVQKLSETKPIQATGEALSPLTEKLMNLAQKYPEASKDVEDIMNVAVLGFGKAAQAPLAETTGKALTKAGGTLERGATQAIETQQGGFIRKLVRPEQTKAVKEAQVPRTTETGGGLFKRSVIEPTTQELASEQAIKSIPGVSARKTYQQNYNVIRDANRAEAEKLVAQLKQVETQVGKDRGFFTPGEFKGYMDSVKRELADNPILVGDAEKTASKILDKFSALVKEEGHTPSGLLSARKKLDSWMESQKGVNVFDPKTESAMSIALRGIRQGGNDFLASKVPDVPVKESLARQSALFRALDNIAPKAATEADTAIGRAFQNMATAVGIKNKLVQQVAAIVGIGGLGAAATFAPAAAVAGGLGFLVYRGGKLVLKPELRLQLGKLLQQGGNKLSPKDKRILENAVMGRDITDGLKRKIQETPNKQGGFIKNPLQSPVKDISKAKASGQSFELQPLTQEVAKMKLVPAEAAFRKLEQTGSAIIGERPGMRLVIKDEGDFFSLGLDTGRLTPTDVKLPALNFATKEEAFVALKPLYEKVPVQSQVSKELSSLAQEARKFKSAEEFAKNITPKIYRDYLNEVGPLKQNMRVGGTRPGGFGSTTRKYGDYLYNQDRETFNLSLKEFRAGEETVIGKGTVTDFYNQVSKTRSQLKAEWDGVGNKANLGSPNQ